MAASKNGTTFEAARLNDIPPMQSQYHKFLLSNLWLRPWLINITTPRPDTATYSIARFDRHEQVHGIATQADIDAFLIRYNTCYYTQVEIASIGEAISFIRHPLAYAVMYNGTVVTVYKEDLVSGYPDWVGCDNINFLPQTRTTTLALCADVGVDLCIIINMAVLLLIHPTSCNNIELYHEGNAVRHVRTFNQLSAIEQEEWHAFNTLCRNLRPGPLDRFDFLTPNLDAFTRDEIFRCDRLEPVVTTVVVENEDSADIWEYRKDDGKFALRGSLCEGAPKAANMRK